MFRLSRLSCVEHMQSGIRVFWYISVNEQLLCPYKSRNSMCSLCNVVLGLAAAILLNPSE